DAATASHLINPVRSVLTPLGCSPSAHNARLAGLNRTERHLVGPSDTERGAVSPGARIRDLRITPVPHSAGPARCGAKRRALRWVPEILPVCAFPSPYGDPPSDGDPGALGGRRRRPRQRGQNVAMTLDAAQKPRKNGAAPPSP